MPCNSSKKYSHAQLLNNQKNLNPCPENRFDKHFSFKFSLLKQLRTSRNFFTIQNVRCLWIQRVIWKQPCKTHVSLVQIMRYSSQRPQQIETSILQMNIFDINANIIKQWVFSTYICHPTKARSLFTLLHTGYDTSALEIMFRWIMYLHIAPYSTKPDNVFRKTFLV